MLFYGRLTARACSPRSSHSSWYQSAIQSFQAWPTRSLAAVSCRQHSTFYQSIVVHHKQRSSQRRVLWCRLVFRDPSHCWYSIAHLAAMAGAPLLQHIPPPTVENHPHRPFTDDCYFESSEPVQQFRQRVDSGMHSPLITLMNIQWTHIALDRVSCRMIVDRRQLQPYGLLHGGINALLAENLGSVLGSLHSPTSVVGTSVSAHHLSSGQPGDIVTASATPIKIGKQLSVFSIIVNAEHPNKPGQQRTLAVCKLTTMARPSRESLEAAGSRKFQAMQSVAQLDINKFDVAKYLKPLQAEYQPSMVASDVIVKDGIKGWEPGRTTASPLNTVMGLQFTYVSRSRLDAVLVCDERHTQAAGLMHGGCNGIVAEELGSVLASLAVSDEPAGRVGTFVEAHHLGSAFIGDTVRGSATMIKNGRTTQLTQIDVYARSPGSAEERLIASCELATFQLPQAKQSQNANSKL